jgi:hypothetical protein
MTELKRNFYLLLPTVVMLLSAIIYNTYRDNLLKENGKYTNAVIYEFAEKGKYGSIKVFRYKYIVDGTEYKGGGVWSPKSDILSIGDTIIIIYNKNKPNKSEAKRTLDLKWWQR